LRDWSGTGKFLCHSTPPPSCCSREGDVLHAVVFSPKSCRIAREISIKGKGMESRSEVREITVEELSKKMSDQADAVVLIDVREEVEKQIADIGGVRISLAEIVARQAEIPRDREVVIYCRSGGRSAEAVRVLQKQFGYDNLVNLRGGILDWADKIDPNINKY
jgi:rhodanese-related sulfurtransferase